MSALKRIAGLATGISAVAVIGVAVAQGVPPNPLITNPALGAGEQTVQGTPIGETGVLAWAPMVQQTATLTKEEEAQKAAVASESQPAEPVAQAPAQSETVAQAAPTPAPSENTNTLGAGPAPQEEKAPAHTPKHDRG